MLARLGTSLLVGYMMLGCSRFHAGTINWTLVTSVGSGNGTFTTLVPISVNAPLTITGITGTFANVPIISLSPG